MSDTKTFTINNEHPSELVRRALDIATKAHEGQVRDFKDKGQPYIQHLVRVAQIVACQGYGENVIAAALLHDILEDTAVTISALQDIGVPSVVIETVDRLTHYKADGETFTQYIQKVMTNNHAHVIKIADIKDNLKSFPDKGSLRDKHELALLYLEEKL